MSTADQVNTSAPPAYDTRFFGHPLGLSTLFFAEMWERFSFYSLKTLMTLFMPLAILEGGLGFSDEQTGMVIALYASLVYLANYPGGWVADKVLGLRWGVLCGGLVIMAGHICLAFHGVSPFFSGLALVVVGTGLLKPNMSAMVGQLYPPGDMRRDAGFSLYYMGINLGAFLAPLIAGYLAQGAGFRAWLERLGIDPHESWHFGFGAAAVGMFFGLVQYVLGGRFLGNVGRRAPQTPQQREQTRLILLIGLSTVAAIAIVAGALHWTGVMEITLPRLNAVLGIVLVLVPVCYFAFNLIAGPFTREERRRLGAVAILFIFSTIYFTGLE